MQPGWPSADAFSGWQAIALLVGLHHILLIRSNFTAMMWTALSARPPLLPSLPQWSPQQHPTRRLSAIEGLHIIVF